MSDRDYILSQLNACHSELQHWAAVDEDVPAPVESALKYLDNAIGAVIGASEKPHEKYPPMTRDYFIAKFEAIPDEKWTTGKYMDKDGRCCALGHCGVLEIESYAGDDYILSKEGATLQGLFDEIGRGVSDINDGQNPKYQQPTPKARILAALRDLPEG